MSKACPVSEEDGKEIVQAISGMAKEFELLIKRLVPECDRRQFALDHIDIAMGFAKDAVRPRWWERERAWRT